MAQNKVEYHIQDGAIFTFKVAATKNVKIGQIVEIVGDRTVQATTAASEKIVGVVYGGTVGKDGVTVGFNGDEGDVVSVVVFKPFVYLEAGGAIAAGDKLTSGANGTAVKHATPAAGAASTTKQVFGMALQTATAGQRFLAIQV